MPANSCAFTVFCNKDVLQLIGAEPGKPGRGSADRKQKFGNVVRLVQLFLAKVVAPAKRNNATLSLESVKIEFLEWQVAYFRDQRRFLITRDEIRLVPEAFRKTGLRAPE